MQSNRVHKDAEVTIEEETGLSIDYTDCYQAEAATITNLAVNHVKANSITMLIRSLHAVDQD